VTHENGQRLGIDPGGNHEWSALGSGDRLGLDFLFFCLLRERDHLELSRREIAEGGVPPLAVVEGLDVVEDCALKLTPIGPGATALSKQSPREPIETAMPASRAAHWSQRVTPTLA
jgi:hypothetical protein